MAYQVVLMQNNRLLVNLPCTLKRKKISAMYCRKFIKASSGKTVGGEKLIYNLMNTPNYSRFQNSKEMVGVMALF